MKKLAILSILGAALCASTCCAGNIVHAYVPVEDITSTGTKVLAGQDDAVVAANIGFTFANLGSAVWIGTNGVLSFGTAFNSPANTTIADAPAAIIAPLWDDWQFMTPGTGGVYYETEGDPGDERFVVEWNQARDQIFLSQASVTFEAILFQSGEVEFAYGNVNTGDAHGNGKSATVGATSYGQWSFNLPDIGSSSGFILTPPSTSAASISTSSTEEEDVAVPEPTSLLMLASGLAACARLCRRKIISR